MPAAMESDAYLNSMIQLFYADRMELGVFERTPAEQCPTVYRSLLDHTAHMTVTVEQHHQDCRGRGPVRSTVRKQVPTENPASSCLRSSRRAIWNCPTRSELPACRHQVTHCFGNTPLGRILIESKILREVQLCDLWKVHCGKELAGYFSVADRNFR